MTTNAFSSAGTLIYISAKIPADTSNCGLMAHNFTKIGEITDIGEIGKVYEEFVYYPIGQEEEVVEKGNYQYTVLELEMAVGFENDAGQVILDDAVTKTADYSFKIVLGDDRTLSFTGQVFSSPVFIGTADNIVTRSARIHINSDIMVYISADGLELCNYLEMIDTLELEASAEIETVGLPYTFPFTLE